MRCGIGSMETTSSRFRFRGLALGYFGHTVLTVKNVAADTICRISSLLWRLSGLLFNSSPIQRQLIHLNCRHHGFWYLVYSGPNYGSSHQALFQVQTSNDMVWLYAQNSYRCLNHANLEYRAVLYLRSCGWLLCSNAGSTDIYARNHVRCWLYHFLLSYP